MTTPAREQSSFDQPSIKLIFDFLLSADSAHRLLQAAERLPIPVKVASELKEEGPVFRVEFPPEQFEIVHVAQDAIVPSAAASRAVALIQGA